MGENTPADNIMVETILKLSTAAMVFPSFDYILSHKLSILVVHLGGDHLANPQWSPELIANIFPIMKYREGGGFLQYCVQGQVQ